MNLQKPQRQTESEIRKVKATVRCRDGHACRCCGKGTYDEHALDVHELKRRGAGGKVSRENSVTLCRRCHDLVGARLIRVIGDNCDEELLFEMKQRLFSSLFGPRVPRYLVAHILVVK